MASVRHSGVGSRGFLAQAAAPQQFPPVEDFELRGDAVGGGRCFTVDAAVGIRHRPGQRKRQAEGDHADQSDDQAQDEPHHFSPFSASRRLSARASPASRMDGGRRERDENRENCPGRRGTRDLAPADARALSFFTGRLERAARKTPGGSFRHDGRGSIAGASGRVVRRGSRATLALVDLYGRDRLRCDPAVELWPHSPDDRFGPHVFIVADRR